MIACAGGAAEIAPQIDSGGTSHAISGEET